MPDLTEIPTPLLMVTNAGGNTRLTVRTDLLAMWFLVGLGPFAAENSEHPLAGGRPVATTDSDNPLDRWEAEMVAESLAAVQHAQRELTDAAAKNVLVRLVNAARAAGEDVNAVGVATDEDELDELLSWLNRNYVRLRTDVSTETEQVGVGQSAAMFLGLDDDGATSTLPAVDNPVDAAQMLVAIALAESVELLSAELYG